MSEPSLSENLAREPAEFSPAFGRRFLAIWGVCAGISWAAMLANPFLLPPVSLIANAMSAFLYLFLSLADGAAMAAFIVLFPSIILTSGRRRLKPVHWMLLAWGAFAFAGCLVNGVFGFWFRAGFSITSFGHLSRACNALAIGVMCIYSAWGLASAGQQRWWWMYFLLHTAASALAGLIGVVETITYVQSRFASPGFSGISENLEIIVIPSALTIVALVLLAAYIALVVATVIDIRRKKPRVWLDKLGIALVMVYPALRLMNWLGMALCYYWLN